MSLVFRRRVGGHDLHFPEMKSQNLLREKRNCLLLPASTNVGYLCRSELLVEFFGRPLVLISSFLCPLLSVVNRSLGGHPDGQLGSAEKRLISNESSLEFVESRALRLPGLAGQWVACWLTTAIQRALLQSLE